MGRYGIAPLRLEDRSTFHPVWARLAQPISDYTFANLVIWSACLRVYWASLSRHLCVFANGTGELTMLLPPLPEEGADVGDLRRSLEGSFAVMDAYNQEHSDRSRSRIEYVSDEMLERINAATGGDFRLSASPMSGDYVYPLANVVDLAGGALKSKRHARSKFVREHPDHRVELLEERHLPGCFGLLRVWQGHADRVHAGQLTEDDLCQRTAVLRDREVVACRRALECYRELGLKGLVLYVGDRLVGFTLGEAMSPAQASILFEKTHPEYPGSAQLICSEFCQRCWGDYPEVNFGDDWGIPTLRFTKESYRPTRRLSKYVLSRPGVAGAVWPAASMGFTVQGAVGPGAGAIAAGGSCAGDRGDLGVLIRRAVRSDAAALVAIERSCFAPSEVFGYRQIRDLIQNEHVVCRVAEADRRVVGWSVVFVRQHHRHRSGRIYNLAVDPAYQGRGIGHRLAKHVLDEMAGIGVRNVYLEVRCDNAGAVSLYGRLGFSVIRRLVDYYGPGVHGLSMKLALGGPGQVGQFLLFTEEGSLEGAHSALAG